MVASRLLIMASCACSSTLAFTPFGFTLSTFAMRFSTLPYSKISLVAVFSPTPGIPGILSDWSPIRPLKSMNWVGVKPYLSIMACRSYRSNSETPLRVRMIFVISVANCSSSLSPVMMSGSIPQDSASFAIVPIRSSASKPSSSTCLMFIARRISFKIGTSMASSGGIFFLPALYPSYAL